MKKIPVKEVNGFASPAQPLPQGIEVICDGKFYYVLEHNSNKNSVAYKEFKVHKEKMENERKAAEALQNLSGTVQGAI